MPAYTLYVDVWLLRLGCNFIFEYLLLWATANVLKVKIKRLRLVIGATIGTIYYLLYRLASLGLIPFYGLLRFLPTVILVSFAMIMVAFYPLTWSRLLNVAAHFYGIGFAAAGAGLASSFIMGGTTSPHYVMGTFVSILTILLIAELGWGIVHKRMVQRVYQVPLEVTFQGNKIKVKSLIDTGNNLKDPLNREPVIIVEQQALTTILPACLIEMIDALGQGKLNAIDQLSRLGDWQKRIRLIPFDSIGKQNGMLIGLRPDSVLIANQDVGEHFHPTIAIHPHTLDPNGEYNALIPAHIMEHSYNLTSLKSTEGGGSHVSTSSSDV